MFWTSGRDAQSPSQFVWDNYVVLNSSVVDVFTLESQNPITCLIFKNYGETVTSYEFMSRSCLNKHRILCEVVHDQ